MNIICCGAGTVGVQAAEALVAAGHNVTVIDLKEERLRALGDRLDVKTFHGSCAHADVLGEAGAGRAGMVLASTNADEVNLLTAAVGKALGAKMTVARVHGSGFFEHRNLDYRRLLGIDHLICPEYSTAMAIASFLRNPGAILPGTRMPSFWPDYPASFYDPLGKDGAKQVRAIRDHLLTLH